MKKSVVIVLLSVLLLALQMACQSSVPTALDTLVVGIEKKAEHFDPRLPKDAVSQKINKLIYNGLLKKEADLKLIPDLALTFKMQNPLTYVFKLRADVFFHNGQKLTSADVKATYESMQKSAIKSPYKSNLDIIDAIETPDAQTVIFKLKKIFTPFATLMTLGILPKAFATLSEKGMAENQALMVGTGPYQLDPEHDTLNQIALKRFDKAYVGQAKSARIIFRVVQDSTLRTLELLKGRLDLVQNDIPFVLVPYLKEQKEIKSEVLPGINFSYLAYNLKNPYLKERRVREALALAIDRDKIIKYKLAGLAEKATSLMSPTHWVFDHSLKPYHYDLERARALLDETEFKDPDGLGPKPRFKLIYKTSSVKERVEIAELIAEDLAKIGIDVTVQSFEFGTFFRDVRQGDFDIYTLTWVGLSDPDIYYEVFHSTKVPPTGANRGFYKNDLLDELLEKSRVTLAGEALKKIYQAIQKQVYEAFYYAPLWYDQNIVFMRKNVHGYKMRSDASYIHLKDTYKTSE